MTRDLHLTDEALLELAGERLSSSDEAQVREHLSSCTPCRERFAKLKVAHSVFERLAEVGFGETLEQTGGTAVIRTRAGFPGTWVGALGLVGLVVMAFLLSPWSVSNVRASELLDHAVRAESHTGRAVGFSIRVHGEACGSGGAGGKKILTGLSKGCSNLYQRMKATGWSSDNPLSARTYSDWRNSLHRHHDSVEKQANSWRIRTTTNEGPVRAASLEMSASDYHATRLTLDFDDEEEVSISEADEAPSQPIAANVETATALASQAGRALDEEADLQETTAWTQLHKLGADTGWEAIVLRTNHRVQVKAFVETDERRQAMMTAFAPYPRIVLEVHPVNSKISHRDVSPQRAGLEGYAPGLAEAWLETRFPDADARMEYSNNILSLSQHILGRTFFLDKLRQRQAAMANCSCSGEMTDLIVDQERTLSRLQADLSQNLEPLIGAPMRPTERPLSLSEAHRLDVALEELLSSSPGANEAALDACIQQVRRLL